MCVENISAISFLSDFAADGLVRVGSWDKCIPIASITASGRRLVVDIICIAYPIGYIYFVYDIPISMTEMMAIVLWPRLLWSAKCDQFSEIMRIKMARSLRKESKSVTLDYAAVNDEVAKSAKLQENSFPRIVRRGLALYNIVRPFLPLCYYPTPSAISAARLYCPSPKWRSKRSENLVQRMCGKNTILWIAIRTNM